MQCRASPRPKRKSRSLADDGRWLLAGLSWAGLGARSKSREARIEGMRIENLGSVALLAATVYTAYTAWGQSTERKGTREKLQRQRLAARSAGQQQRRGRGGKGKGRRGSTEERRVGTIAGRNPEPAPGLQGRTSRIQGRAISTTQPNQPSAADDQLAAVRCQLF